MKLGPIYGSCVAKAFGGLPAKFVWWGCTYVVHPTAKLKGGDAWKGKISIECPGSYWVEWNVYETQQRYEEAALLCVTRMPPQKTAGEVEIRNVGSSPRKVAIRWDLHGIEYETFGSPLFCGSTRGIMQHDASYRGGVVVAAEDAAGKPVDLTLKG